MPFKGQDFIDVRAHLAAIINSSDDAILSKNLEGVIASWNPAAERIFGYTPEEAVGKHISLIIPQDRLDEEYVILGKVKNGERVDHFETIRKTKDGKDVYVSLTVSPINDATGKVIGASKIVRDISLIKEAERASAYLAAIVESSDDVVISKNLDGTVTSWNRSAERVFGYTADEMVGNHISVLIPPENLDEEYGILARIKAGERIDHFETIRRTKAGKLINVSLTVSPIKDKTGKIIGASKIARDVTEQIKTQEVLRESAAKKDEFLVNISHELRTPMNAIIGLANIIGMSPSLQESEKKYVSTLIGSAENLMVLINNLLDFSKMESGSLELEQIEFDLPDTVQRVVNLLEIKAKEKNLDLKIKNQEPLNRFYIGDAFRLQQILTNLIGNAVKFTEQGSIEVTVTGIENDLAKSVRIEVLDTGIGIPEDKLDIIFNKFTQADASTTRKFGVTGLGLSLARSFAAQMGGTITARSRVGLGSTFTLELPLAMGTVSSAMDNMPDAPVTARKNVLVVEDYEPNVMVIGALLDRCGYNYDVASNGAQAVQHYRTTQYDTILMDVQMEEMDGLESAARIRELESQKGIKRTPIIAMTAHVQERDKNKCIEAGMDDFIAKPFELEELAGKLRKLIA